MTNADDNQPFAEIETRVDSHYPDGLISMGTIVELFGIAGGKLVLEVDGDAGLMRSFSSLEFLAPAYQGDYIRVRATLTGTGRTSRKIRFEAFATVRQHGVGTAPTHGAPLDPPIVIATAEGIAIVPDVS